MKANIGSTDRLIRIVVGVALLSLFFFLEGNARWLGAIGIVPLLTGLFRSCPLYTVLGLSTCPLQKQ